jgi:hypothetical protein
MWDSLAAHATSLGYALECGDTGTANGWTNPDTRTVRVSDTLNDAHAAKTLTHEVAHIQCEHVTDMNEYRQHRGRTETEAESVAYIVAGVFGLDSTAYSVPYVAGWAGKTGNRRNALTCRDVIRSVWMSRVDVGRFPGLRSASAWALRNAAGVELMSDRCASARP